MPNNKKKKSAKKVGNKKKAAPPSQAAVTCVQCARPVKPAQAAIPCICTTVVFCSPECQELGRSSSSSSSHAASCPGPPDDVDVIDIGKKMREESGWSMGGSDGQTMVHRDADYQRRWQEEHCREIKEPIAAVLLQQALRSPQQQHWARFDPSSSSPDMSTDEYAKFADQGHACFAYIAGVRYKNRILGKLRADARFTADNKGYASGVGILTTDQLAFKYLLQASEAGIGLAMQSLAECYEKGQGVRKSMLECRDWLWHATLLDSAGAREMIDSKTILPREFVAQSHMLESFAQFVSPGQGVQLAGPNIASLMLVMYKELKAMKYKVPAFAGPTPTLTAGNPPRRTSTSTSTTMAPAVKLLGANEIQEVTSLIEVSESKGNKVTMNYGRRGVSKEATVQTYGPAERSIDNLLFRVPPLPACDERLDPDQVARWIAHAKEAELPELLGISFTNSRALEVHCVHAKDDKPLLVCQQCIDDACERLAAVSTGSVVLSIEEPLDCRGQVAIWRRSSADANSSMDGNGAVYKSETFKAYGRGEVECLLASLVACAHCFDVKVVHPLFVAQDPNFFWPLIYSHGSIRAALEYVAPHVDWNSELGPIRARPEAGFGILKTSNNRGDDDDDDHPEIVPGDLLRTCGNDLCLNLEPNRSKGSFRICAKCERRSYCSPACQQADWPWHKRECQAASSGRIPAQQDPLLASNSRQQGRLHFSPPSVDEEVVVHGLVSKPEYNGRLGIITGDVTSSGRYPVKLPNHPSTLAVKPTNFHRLGVYISSKPEKKTGRFRCAEHGKEVCVPCCLDFAIVNHLYKLRATNITTGPLSKEAVEQISETHFATITRADEDIETCYDKNVPMECQGLADSDKRVVLKALLESSQPRSMRVVAAIAGLTCFGARAEVVTRPYAVLHLKELVDMW